MKCREVYCKTFPVRKGVYRLRCRSGYEDQRKIGSRGEKMTSTGREASGIHWLRDWHEANHITRNKRRFLLIDVEKDN
jgi:hypothetical protein